jgi:integrase
MAHIERRGPRKYRARYRGPDGKERSKTFYRERDAAVWLASVETSKHRGEWIDPTLGKTTFEAWSTDWFDTLTVRPSTLAVYEYVNRCHLLPTFGAVQVGRITPAMVRRWYAQLTASPLAQATVAKSYKLLARMMRAAVDDGLIAKSPCSIKGAGTERSPEMQFADVEQVWRIAEATTPRYRALVLLAAFGGLRFGELAGLRRRRVDLLHRTIAVTEQITDVRGQVSVAEPKTHAGRRVVALPPFLAAELEAHLRAFSEPGAGGLVFPAPEGGPLRRSNFRRRVWLPALEKAGIPNLRFHDLRHTAGTLTAQTGATTKEVMARLGHASPRAALIYQHATEERDAAIAAALENLAASPRPPDPDDLSATVARVR